MKLQMGSIHPAVSEICVPQSLDPICAKFDKFLAHGQAHIGQMGKWPWQCTTTGLDNSTELWTVKIHPAVTEICVPQIWQPPARPPARTVTTIPLQPGGLRGNKQWNFVCILLFFFSQIVTQKDHMARFQCVWCYRTHWKTGRCYLSTGNFGHAADRLIIGSNGEWQYI